MARDIFNRITDDFGGAFSADSATLVFPAVSDTGAVTGLLIQNLQMTYSQQVTRLYEIGSPRIYYVGGRTDGKGAMQRIIGPAVITQEFLKKFGDVCAANNSMEIQVETDCSTNNTAGGAIGGTVAYTANYVVITSVGVSIAAQDMVINSDTQFMFSNFTENVTN